MLELDVMPSSDKKCSSDVKVISFQGFTSDEDNEVFSTDESCEEVT